RLGIAPGYVGQDLAVQLALCCAQAVHELTVRHPLAARRGVDARDPEAAEVALAVAAVAVGVRVRLQQRLLGAPVARVALAAVALGARERRAALLAGVGGALDAAHLRSSSFTRPLSAGATSTGLPRRRLRRALFFSRMWLVIA